MKVCDVRMYSSGPDRPTRWVIGRVEYDAVGEPIPESIAEIP
jgi:hypothetical protein